MRLAPSSKKPPLTGDRLARTATTRSTTTPISTGKAKYATAKSVAKCDLTSALSGPREAYARRRGRDNLPRARGASLPSSHGPLQRIVRRHDLERQPPGVLWIVAYKYVDAGAHTLIADTSRPTIREALCLSGTLTAERTILRFSLCGVEPIGRELGWLTSSDAARSICDASITDENLRTSHETSNFLSSRAAVGTTHRAFVRHGV